ncbi:lanthionine synthetase LanC family protein [Arthrobacter sp. H16F315]|uniref:lanthionine synthetase LanC family protein n=1 Tax=Arthrobacter sp. H16F315 TaxID=2955314 RepID=UPI00209846C4|nr:hypothetical protein [Arthrobacter sp. H16F315]
MAIDNRRLAVDQIALWVTDTAFHAGGRSTWLGVQPPPEAQGPPIFSSVGPDLYHGGSGIALFLLEHAADGADESHRLALGALRHAAQNRAHIPAGSRLGLHAGLSGILLALAAAKATPAGRNDNEEDDVFVDATAAEILIAIGSAAVAPLTEFDIVNGAAGAVIGLLASRGAFGGELIAVAERLATGLINAALVVDGAMRWPEPQNPLRLPLTGLSHGASGPGLAFAELFSATGDERWRVAARAAFAYERGWFSESMQNWPDLRKLRAAPKSGSLPYLTVWCHGAAGIGLARAIAGELLNDEQLRDEARIAMNTTMRWVDTALDTPWAGPTMCHGLAGNAEILRTGSEILSQPQWGRTAALASDSLSESVLRAAFDEGEMATPGLMLGWSGIGLFLLGSLRSTKFSALHPRWVQNEYPSTKNGEVV